MPRHLPLILLEPWFTGETWKPVAVFALPQAVAMLASLVYLKARG